MTVAASPRDIRVFDITKRTGYSKTSARKIPMNTMRNVSPIARNATASADDGEDREERASREQELDPASVDLLHGAKATEGCGWIDPVDQARGPHRERRRQ